MCRLRGAQSADREGWVSGERCWTRCSGLLEPFLNPPDRSNDRLPSRAGPGAPILGSSVSLTQHLDEHRPQNPVLLAVDQELGEGAALG